MALVGERALKWLFQKVPLTLKLARWLLARDRYVVAIGGHGGKAFDDNSRAFAKHLRNDPGYMVVWFAGDNATAQRARRSKLRVVRKGTGKASIVLLIAHAAVYSHNISDLYTATAQRVPWRVDVHLGHGVWGLKQAERRPSTTPRWRPDLIIAASEKEAALKSDVYHVPPERVLALGLPKHDALIQPQPPRDTRGYLNVLYAPTWRDWLQHSASEFAISHHLEAIKLLSEAIPPIARSDRPIRVTYLLHKNIRHIRKLAKEYCSSAGFSFAVSTDVDVGDLLENCDWLISDHSGLIWDFMVQGRPTARYVFDEAIYSKLTGGYPEVEQIAAPITFGNASDVWDFLLDDRAAAIAKRLSRIVTPLADGMASERLEMRLAAAIRAREGEL